MAQILVVDDEAGIRELLAEILSDEGHSITMAENAAAARKCRNEKRPDLVLLDIWMPDTDGISLLKEWSAAGLLKMPVIMMSGHGTIDSAVEATKLGAVDFLEKPISMQKLLSAIKKALKNDEIVTKKQDLTLDFFAQSGFLKTLKKRLVQVSSNTRLLFLKNASDIMAEMCARSLLAPRKAWLNLGTLIAPLSREILENTAGGILFVPDLRRLDKLQQKNLSYAVEQLEAHQLLLIVCASCPLQSLADEGWDQALIDKLGEVWITLPLLSAHPKNVPEIAALALSHLVKQNDVPSHHFSSNALHILGEHNWSGEWRELFSTIKNLAISALDEEITQADVEAFFKDDETTISHPDMGLLFFNQPLRDAREAFERIYFEYQLKLEHGNITRIADKTGLERTHLYRKLKQLGLAVVRHSEEREKTSGK